MLDRVWIPLLSPFHTLQAIIAVHSTRMPICSKKVSSRPNISWNRVDTSGTDRPSEVPTAPMIENITITSISLPTQPSTRSPSTPRQASDRRSVLPLRT
ncbi:hypothetical protein D3C78_1188810 [compost metagenome]